jgi:hypothetical protein
MVKFDPDQNGCFMKIKDHFSLVLWPPVWIKGARFESPPSDNSEELILRKVEMVYPEHRDPSRGYIRLSVEFGQKTTTRISILTGKTITRTRPGQIYSGTVTILKAPKFMEQLYQKLQDSIGQTIQEIGDSEIEVA